MKKQSNQPSKGEIVIYQSKQGPQLEVQLIQDSIWLTTSVIAGVFMTDRSSVTKHLNNIVKSGELSEKSNVQFLHIANSDKPVKHYNLDFIISVGYRVNSKKATEFRRWATGILSDHIRKGFTLNQRRIEQLRITQFAELQQALALVKKVKQKELSGDEAKGLLDVITTYANSWALLNAYDQGTVDVGRLTSHSRIVLTYNKALYAIGELKTNLMKRNLATELFGQERDHGIEGVLASIEQGFGGKALYPSIEEKGAHLLYFAIKDHPFSDGNKRIGSLLFLHFLGLNNYLLDAKGERKINDNTLVALAIMIAESDPNQKDVMIKLVVNFLKP